MKSTGPWVLTQSLPGLTMSTVPLRQAAWRAVVFVGGIAWDFGTGSVGWPWMSLVVLRFFGWWLVVGPALWKIWLRQWGWWKQPNINGKIKLMATKPPSRSFKGCFWRIQSAKFLQPETYTWIVWKISSCLVTKGVGHWHGRCTGVSANPAPLKSSQCGKRLFEGGTCHGLTGSRTCSLSQTILLPCSSVLLFCMTLSYHLQS